MAFGAISTFYLPTAANAGSSLWGTDVRKVLSSADAGSDATTKTDHGTGTTAVVRTEDPYSTTTADLDQTLYGWAVQPSDMNSVSGAQRFMLAGNHVATLRVGHTAATSKNANYAMYVYRVGNAAGGRVRTQLATANSGTVAIPALAGELTVTITVAVGAITFGVDETIQYAFEVGAAGTVVTGDVLTMFTGTQSSVVGKIVVPTLQTVYDQSSSLTGDGVSSNGALAVAEVETLTGDGVASRVLGEATVRDLVGDGVTSRVLAETMSRDLAGDGVPSRIVAPSLSRDLSGDGVLSRVVDAGVPRDLTGDGVPDGSKQVTASKTFDLEGAGIITELHPVTASRTFNLTGDGVISGSADIPFPVIPTGDCPSDWSPNDGLKAIAGTVLFHEPPNQGNPVSGATVKLIRDSDGLLIASTTTDPLGAYSFPRDTNDPYTYHVEVNWTDGGTPQQGLSEGGCVPV